MSNKNLSIKEVFVSAYQNYQKGNFKVAENLYKNILNTNPNHFGSNFYVELGNFQIMQIYDN